MKIHSFLHKYFICMIFLGSIFIYSSSSFLSYFFYQDSFYFYKKQTIGILVSLIILVINSKIKPDLYKKYFYIIYILSTFLNILLLLPFFSHQINGAKRWINFFGFIFQPSELLKFNYILSTSHILDSFYDQIKHALLFISLNFTLHAALLSTQSDFGSIVLLAAVTIFLLWNYLYHKKIFFYIFLFLIIGIIPLIYFFPYRLARLYIFLNPWQDTLGKGFQIIQSLIAIHSGGFFGLGLGNSIQKRLFLPMAHTDFILAVIAEEIGLFGTSIIISLILSFGALIIKYGSRIKQIWMQQYCIGSGIIIIIQAIINSSATISLIPTKGIGLPLISYGISSLIGYSIIITIAINIISKNNQIKY